MKNALFLFLAVAAFSPNICFGLDVSFDEFLEATTPKAGSDLAILSLYTVERGARVTIDLNVPMAPELNPDDPRVPQIDSLTLIQDVTDDHEDPERIPLNFTGWSGSSYSFGENGPGLANWNTPRLTPADFTYVEDGIIKLHRLWIEVSNQDVRYRMQVRLTINAKSSVSPEIDGQRLFSEKK